MKIPAAVRRFAIVLSFISAGVSILYGQGIDSRGLRATAYNSHFPEAAKPGEAFNGMGVSRSGTIYYVLSSAKYNIAGQMYSFDPKTKTITHIANLNDAVGQGNIKAVAQGKSHVNFVQSGDNLYFSTHLGYYDSGIMKWPTSAVCFGPPCGQSELLVCTERELRTGAGVGLENQGGALRADSPGV